MRHEVEEPLATSNASDSPMNLRFAPIALARVRARGLRQAGHIAGRHRVRRRPVAQQQCFVRDIGRPEGIPDAVWAAILADLEHQTGGPSDPEVVSAEAVTWNDGSLGCPEAGQAYTQALVEGYQVILEVDGERYDYRVGSGARREALRGRSARGRRIGRRPRRRTGEGVESGRSLDWRVRLPRSLDELRFAAPLALSCTTSIAPRGFCVRERDWVERDRTESVPLARDAIEREVRQAGLNGSKAAVPFSGSAPGPSSEKLTAGVLEPAVRRVTPNRMRTPAAARCCCQSGRRR